MRCTGAWTGRRSASQLERELPQAVGVLAIFVMPDEPDWDERARRLLILVSDGLRHGA